MSIPTFSLAYTSIRARTIPEVVRLWNSRAARPIFEWVIAVDDGDAACLEAAKACASFSSVPVRIVINTGAKNCVAGWNAAAAHTTGRVIIAVSDDFVPPEDWDHALLSLAPDNWPDGEHAVHVEDGYVRTLMVLPIITRKRYERFGYLFYPKYESMFCLEPDTQIWMGDLSFKAVGDISVGEEIIGTKRVFGKTGSGKQRRNFLTVGRTLRVHSREADRVRLKFASGRTVICTTDHMWAYRGDGRLAGSTAKVPKLALKNGPIKIENGFVYGEPRVGRALLHVIDPTPILNLTPECAREIGWLAGIMDGEGCFPVVSQSQVVNPGICAEIRRLLLKYGFEFSESILKDERYSAKSGREHRQINFTLTGGRDAYVRFLNQVRPLKRASAAALNRVLKARFTEPDEIVSMEPVGPGRVVCLTTTTGNFIAGGYLSHNCDTELTEVALRDGVVIDAHHLLFEHMHPDCGKRQRDKSDIVHASQERWNTGEMLFNFRRRAGFPVDDGPKATTAQVNVNTRFAVYMQVTQDDFCLREICDRMVSEGCTDFFFAMPDTYWSGEPVPDEKKATLLPVFEYLQGKSVNVNKRVFELAKYRMSPADSRLTLETRLRNDSLTWIRKAGFDRILIVDGDELWLPGTLELIKPYVEQGHLAIATRMIPVIGVPGYPIEGATDAAVVYIGPKCSFRVCRTPTVQQTMLDQARIIHFTSTRRTKEDNIAKHRRSGHYDDPDYDFEGWMATKLPNAKPGMQDAHMFKPYSIWKTVRHWRPEELAIIPSTLHAYLGT